jgi:hypothetical protein
MQNRTQRNINPVYEKLLLDYTDGALRAYGILNNKYAFSRSASASLLKKIKPNLRRLMADNATMLRVSQNLNGNLKTQEDIKGQIEVLESFIRNRNKQVLDLINDQVRHWNLTVQSRLVVESPKYGILDLMDLIIIFCADLRAIGEYIDSVTIYKMV